MGQCREACVHHSSIFTMVLAEDNVSELTEYSGQQKTFLTPFNTNSFSSKWPTITTAGAVVCCLVFFLFVVCCVLDNLIQLLFLAMSSRKTHGYCIYTYNMYIFFTCPHIASAQLDRNLSQAEAFTLDLHETLCHLFHHFPFSPCSLQEALKGMIDVSFCRFAPNSFSHRHLNLHLTSPSKSSYPPSPLVATEQASVTSSSVLHKHYNP